MFLFIASTYKGKYYSTGLLATELQFVMKGKILGGQETYFCCLPRYYVMYFVYDQTGDQTN